MSTASHSSGLLRGIVVTVLAIALSACGGGSGGGGNAPFLPISLPAQPEQPAPITYRASMTPTAGEVTVGKTLQLAVSMVDSQGRSVTNPATVFTSSDPALATVASQDGAASTGIVTGIAIGSVQITANSTAPDGTVLTQQANVTVVAAPLTYKLVLANPTVTLQFNQSMTVSATMLASDGTDVTATASGWQWTSSDSAVVAVTPSGASVTLLASNHSPTTPASATIAVQTTAPNGSTAAGQIAATALPHYTYQTILSAASAKVASDRTAVVTATVVRSDGVDVTASVQNLNWVLPAPGSTSLAMAMSNNNTTATFTSTRPNLNVSPSEPPGPDAGVQTIVSVQASDSPAATLVVTEFAQYTSVVTGQLSGPINTPISFEASLFHSSADGAPNVTSGCGFWHVSFSSAPRGAQLSIDKSNPNRTMFAARYPTPGDSQLTLGCESSTHTLTFTAL